jgi:YVTN family beta-propeller protein
VVFGAGSLWVSNSADDTVSRIDPATNEVTATIHVCGAPEGFAAAGGRVWIVCEDDGAVGAIDPGRNRMVSTIPVGASPRFAAAAFGDLWVSNYAQGTVSRIDPTSGDVIASIETDVGPQQMVEHDGALWVSATDAATVERIDPETNTVVDSVPIAAGTPDGLVSVGGTLWVANEEGPVLTPIDADGHAGIPQVVGDEPLINANQLVVETGGRLWLPILGKDWLVAVRI